LAIHNLEGRDESVVFWFTYDEFGGVGQMEDDQLSAEMMITSGGRFGPDFDPDEVSLDVIGTVALTMADCSTIQMKYEVDGMSGEQTLIWTYLVPGVTCSAQR
jgi:hypothetical protein